MSVDTTIKKTKKQPRKMGPDIAVIIPVYNEGPKIRSVVESVQKYFTNVVCVNDGSRDNSAAEITATGAILVNHPVNLGAGAATQTGINFALQDPDVQYFVTFDGDGQHQIEDVQPMLAYLQERGLDVVFGSRFLGTVKNVSQFKATFLRFVEMFNGLTTNVELSDPHIGLRVFNRLFASNLNITLSGFAHASDIVAHIRDGKFRYGEFPVTVEYTEYSKKKGQPMLNSINIVFDLLFQKVTKK
jgi:glycosyltransferase involved in cell wall biosynthesis